MDEPQKYELDIDHGTVNVEHDVSWITLGIVCVVLWAPCWWYDDEIRCALGNEKKCAALKLSSPAKQP